MYRKEETVVPIKVAESEPISAVHGLLRRKPVRYALTIEVD